MIEILLIIIAIILWCIGQSICDLTNVIKPISEYYFKKQRNQLNEVIDVRIQKGVDKE